MNWTPCITSNRDKCFYDGWPNVTRSSYFLRATKNMDFKYKCCGSYQEFLNNVQVYFQVPSQATVISLTAHI